MKLTKDYLTAVQIELFYSQMNLLEAEDIKLNEYFNIARNLACSEWERGILPTASGGREGLIVTKILPKTTDLLKKNFEQQKIDISYRRYALMKAYWPIIKDRIGTNNECFNYWEQATEID